MSSIASRQYVPQRSRLSSGVLLAILILATPGALQSQRPPTKADSQAQRAAGRAVPPRSDTSSAPRESTFVQRLLTAIAAGLASRDSTTQQPRQPQPQPQQQILMPNVVGMDTTTALRTLGLSTQRRFKTSLTYTIVPPPAPSIPVDTVAAQLPLAGTVVTGLLKVRLTLAGAARPPDSLTVPRLLGRLERDAADTLKALRFVEDRLTKGVTSPDDIGRVIGQNPPAGTTRVMGGTVAITIGEDARVVTPKVAGQTKPRPRKKGTPELRPADTVARRVIMPVVVGLDSVMAVRTLAQAGLRNYRFRVPVDTAAVDTVRAQSPPSGRRVPPDTAIVLTLGVRTIIAEAATSGWRWLAVVALVVAFFTTGALTARSIWPPPQIVPRVRLEPMFTDIVGANGSLVSVSISLRSHVEHEQSVLDLSGSPLD